ERSWPLSKEKIYLLLAVPFSDPLHARSDGRYVGGAMRVAACGVVQSALEQVTRAAFRPTPILAVERCGIEQGRDAEVDEPLQDFRLFPNALITFRVSNDGEQLAAPDIHQAQFELRGK